MWRLKAASVFLKNSCEKMFSTVFDIKCFRTVFKTLILKETIAGMEQFCITDEDKKTGMMETEKHHLASN